MLELARTEVTAAVLCCAALAACQQPFSHLVLSPSAMPVCRHRDIRYNGTEPLCTQHATLRHRHETHNQCDADC